MTTIKLNNYYPHLTECITLEVSEEIAVTLSIGGRQCDSYKRRKREHDECSLDGTPGFEADVTYPPLTPEEIMEQAEDRATLYAALDRLPPVQARRVYARFILGRSVGQIAKAEGVEERNVRETINKGLRRLKKYLDFSR
nr:sigma-70 family RNA polymerase sigma factor [uncultured Oscillibacter sp.]